METQNELPLGLSMALAKNLDAMQYFTSLTPMHQREIIAKTHGINSKDEMQKFVDNISSNNWF